MLLDFVLAAYFTTNRPCQPYIAGITGTRITGTRVTDTRVTDTRVTDTQMVVGKQKLARKK